MPQAASAAARRVLIRLQAEGTAWGSMQMGGLTAA